MKILLVDDSKSARYALRLQLQRHGVEVETADSAESAFDLLKSDLPDAILMDHMMPGLNGFEALEVLREDPRTASIPVVMCSSHEEPDFVATARRKGVLDILPKSLAAEKLPQVLAKLTALLSPETSAQAGAVESARIEAASAPAETASAPEGAVDAGGATAQASLTEQDIRRMVEGTLEAQLTRLLMPMLEELRRDLTENLLAEARQLIEAQLAAERERLGAAPKPPSQDDVRDTVLRLIEAKAPEICRVELEGERGQILEMVDRIVQTQGRKLAGGGPGDLDERLQALETRLGEQALVTARRESNDAMERALTKAAAATDSVMQVARSNMTRIYVSIVAAAVLGVAAAGGVYLMLGG